MRPNLFGPFSKKTFFLNYSFRGKGWSFNLPPGLPTHRGIQPWGESWPCLRWAKSWALKHLFPQSKLAFHWKCLYHGRFESKEIECQKCTCGQDGALQENTVQKNFKKPRCVQALGATKHGTILSFFEKATPPPQRPHPNKLAQHIHPFAVNRYPWQVPILSNEDCQAKVLGNETIENSMLCAGGDGIGTNKVNYDWIFRGEEHFSVDIFLPGW